MKTIIFPTDFSDGTKHAFDFAAKYCTSNKIKLIVQHSYFAMAQESGLSNEVMQTLITNAENDANDRCEKLKNEIKTQYPNLDFDMQSKFGFPIDNIVTACKETDANMVIMATKGAKGLIDRIAGTIALGVAERVNIPVLAIPYGYKLEKIEQMLYATNFEEKDKTIIGDALGFAKHFDANIQAIHIIEEYEPQIDSAAKKAEEFKNYFASDHLQIRNLKRGEVEHGIETYVHTHKPDVLILAHQHRGFWSSIFHFSVTKYFAFHAELPILIYPS
ncbi:MAG: universal stress protein [Bacteroidetes bacterium]|nr:universal stress protein [Bacteroidota bacterium]